MTLSDMSVQEQEIAAAEAPARARCAPADRRSKRATVAAQQVAAVAELVSQARADGDALTGPSGLLKRITAMVLEAALEEEMTEHLGHARHQDPPGRAAVTDTGAGTDVVGEGDSGSDARNYNVRNGTRTKTILTDGVGEVEIRVPRDRAGTFVPVIVAKHQRRLGSVETMVLSLTAKGLTSGEISAHLEEIYGASVGKDTICRITDRVVEEMREWLARPLEPVYAAIFVDAIVVKVKDGQVANRPFYAAIGVSVEGRKDEIGRAHV